MKYFCMVTVFLGLLPIAISPAHALDDKEVLSMEFEDTIGENGLERSGKTLARPAQDAGKDCTLAITYLEDHRKNRETVGGSTFRIEAFPNYAPLAVQSVRSGDGVKWMKSAAESLKRYGFDVRLPQSAEPTPGMLPAGIKLKLAHVWTAGFSLNSHVTIEAAFATQSGPILRRYHGFGIKTNWWNANSEYMETLNLAVAEILDSLVRDASASCKAGPKT